MPAEFTISIPWSQLDIPKLVAGVLERAMELSLEDFRNDTEFYDPETRAEHARIMNEIRGRISNHNASVRESERIDFDGTYTGGTPRYPEHLRDCWTGWNIENDQLVLLNHAPAANYLFNGNSPGGGGGDIKPRFSNYMTYYCRRAGSFGSKWRRAKSVQSVEQSGRQAEFQEFIYKTIQRNIAIAIEEFTLPKTRGGVQIGVMSDPARKQLGKEIVLLNRSITRATSGMKSTYQQRAGVKASDPEFDRLSAQAGAEWYERDKQRRERKNIKARLKRNKEAEAARATVQQKAVKHVAKKTVVKPPAPTVQTQVEKKVVEQTAAVEERLAPPPRTKSKRFEDIRGLYSGNKDLVVKRREKYARKK